MATVRLEPALAIGANGWRIDVVTGNRKKGTLRAKPVTQANYTLQQAKEFCLRNKAGEFAHLVL